MQFPSELQSNVMDCGAACLRNISLHYGINLPISRFHEMSETNSEGVSLYGLSKAAEIVGFNSLAAKINFEQLQNEAPLPLIAYFSHGHFIVVYEITPDEVFISDPSAGLVSFPHEVFISFWIGSNATRRTEDGIVLLLEPTFSSP